MMRMILWAALAVFTLAAVPAQTVVCSNPNGSVYAGKKGKRTGPKDGSGPIHPPGTGGGTGKGQRGPRR
ncbi:MAG: hypothetical protein ACUVS7_05085 [Bryobacteraceae bacterium]